MKRLLNWILEWYGNRRILKALAIYSKEVDVICLMKYNNVDKDFTNILRFPTGRKPKE